MTAKGEPLEDDPGHSGSSLAGEEGGVVVRGVGAPNDGCETVATSGGASRGVSSVIAVPLNCGAVQVAVTVADLRLPTSALDRGVIRTSMTGVEYE